MSKSSRAVLCSSCRRLVSSSEKVCPWCGARQPTLFGLAPSLHALFRDSFDPVWLVISSCVALYMGALILDPSELTRPSGLFSIGSPQGWSLLRLGMTGEDIVAAGLWWTPLSAIFLHGSLLHIFFNLSWIRDLGPMAAQIFGKARFFILFCATGVAGFVFSNLVSGAPTIGASCSIFGLIGAVLSYGKRRGGTWGAALSRQALSWAVGGLMISLALPNVNNWGHLGGLAAGLALGWVLPPAERQEERRGAQLLALALALACGCAVLASLVVTADLAQTP